MTTTHREHSVLNTAFLLQVFKDFEFKDRMFTSLTDLITLAIFLTISPAVRDAFYNKGDKKDTTAFKAFLTQVAGIQRDALWWLHDVVPKLFKTASFNQLYPRCLHKVLFMVGHDEYYMTDGWPEEKDRPLYFKATSEIPLMHDTVIRIFLIGLSKSHPLNGRDTIDLTEMLVKRAASLQALVDADFKVLRAENPHQVIEFLTNLAGYNYPESISLPPDYVPPSVAVSHAYWKMFIILTIYCAHNPADFGALAWKEYPIIRSFMEMCITNQFVFPPPTIASGEEAEALKAAEMQTAAAEKQTILTFESHLAAATSQQHKITESTSLLLTQLISTDLKGPLRKPPQNVMTQLQQVNQMYKIGHLLCRSRNPEFLLDILNRQGTDQAMPWLSDLVESEVESSLPVQCLCEFLLNSVGAGATAASAEIEASGDMAAKEVLAGKRKKERQLLAHLQSLLRSADEADRQQCCETLDYFLRRLSSQQTSQRLQALKGLRLILTPLADVGQLVQAEGEDQDAWLLKHLPSLPCFPEFFTHISTALRHACQVENDPPTVGLFVRFLVANAPQGKQRI